MRRDSIFYKLFQQSPTLLFELLPDVPANAEAYRFESIAVKEPTFEIDGVFLPPEDSSGTVYFCEMQFQKDEKLYERVFAESMLYFYRSRGRFRDWQIVIIYPSRRLEQSNLYPHRTFLNGEQMHRIYLDELGDIRQLPVWVGLMVLTTVEETQAPAEARYLISRAQQEVPVLTSRAIMEMVATIMSYRFERLSPREIEAMLDITFEETRLYRDLREAALREGLQQGLQQGLQEGRREGLQDEALNLALRLLRKRLGELSGELQGAVSALPLTELEELSEAVLDFTSLEDLQSWLTRAEG